MLKLILSQFSEAGLPVTSSTTDPVILVNNKLDEYQNLLLCLFIISEEQPIWEEHSLLYLIYHIYYLLQNVQNTKRKVRTYQMQELQ